MIPITVSVVIPSYGKPDRLDRCLLALAQQHVTPFEVLVADDGDPDPWEPKQLCDQYGARWVPGERTLLDGRPHPNVGAAVNRGVAEARGDIVLVIQRDHVLMPDYIGRLGSRYYPGRIVCGLTERRPVVPTQHWVRELTSYCHRPDGEVRFDGLTATDAFVAPFRTWTLADGFDFAADRANWVPMSEDPVVYYHCQQEWTLRMAVNGYRLYVDPLLRLWHFGEDNPPTPEINAAVERSQQTVMASFAAPEALEYGWHLVPTRLVVNGEVRLTLIPSPRI